jgi:hypothetical protein
MKEFKSKISRLVVLIEDLSMKLLTIDEVQFAFKLSKKQWSKKEILGHLIDSATHNHQRFVRAQCEDNPVIYYDQDHWCKYNGYQEMPLEVIISMWNSYNVLIITLVKSFTIEALERKSNDKTVATLFIEYVDHLEHHTRQIFDDV